MNKFKLIIFFVIFSGYAFGSMSYRFKTEFGKLSTTVKSYAKHIFSKDGAKDIAASYGVAMGITAVHELGHAVSANILYGSPIDITLGTSQKDNQDSLYFQIGGIKVRGLNPSVGYTLFKKNQNHNRFKDIIIGAMGPICGALSSLYLYLWLPQNNKYQFARAVALGGLINHTVGYAGIAGLWVPGSDAYHIYKLIKNN